MGVIGNGIKQNRKEDILFRIFLGAIIIVAGLVSVKRIFIGLDIDEQYAVALTYRIARGDMLLKQVWEPHQTSALITLFPVWLFMKLTGSSDHLLLFLRGISVLIQGAVALYWFITFREKAGRSASLISAFLLFLITPKFIQSPEFNNMQVWFFVLTCLFVISGIRKGKAALFLAAGLFLFMEVLAYPSCLLLFIFLTVYLILRGKKQAVLLVLPPVLGGMGLLLYAGLKVGFGNLPTYAGYVLSDSAHSEGIVSKFIGYLSELPQVVLFLIIYAAISALILIVIKVLSVLTKAGSFRLCKADLPMFLAVLNTIAFADQFRSWHSKQAFITYPQYCYLILFISGLVLFLVGGKEIKEKWKSEFFLLGIGTAVSHIAVMSLTNLSIRATFIHLIPGCAAALCLFGDVCRDVYRDARRDHVGEFGVDEAESTSGRGMPKILNITCILMSAVILFIAMYGAGIIVRTSNEGRYNDIRMDYKKVIYGPAKGIYCEYLEGYSLNSKYELLSAAAPSGSKVLYIGTDNLLYMANNYEVCTPSTISTPEYAGNLADYFAVNPEKIPEYILVDSKYADSTGVMGLLDDLFAPELIAENEYAGVYVNE